MLDEMCATLGGRAAEDLVFGKISTGALNDLERVTKQAYAMISYFGMSEKIGNRSYFDSSGQSEYSFSKPYSEKTAELIDDEVKAVVDAQYQRAKNILSKNKAKLSKLAERLLESEVIFSDDLEEIFGKRPWKTEEEEEKQKSVEKAREKQKKIIPKKQQETSEEKDDKEAADKEATDKKEGTGADGKKEGAVASTAQEEKEAPEKKKSKKPVNAKARGNDNTTSGKEKKTGSKSATKKSGE